MHDTLTPTPSRETLPDELNPTQLTALKLILQGESDQSVADRLEVHRTTITRWRNHHPQFRLELNRIRQETLSSAGDTFRSMLAEALQVLQAQLRDPNPTIRFRAAKAILSMAGRNLFAPPEEPLDGNLILQRHAKALAKIDPKEDPTTAIARDFDRLYEIRSFMAQLNPESAPAQPESATKCINRTTVHPCIPIPQPTPAPAATNCINAQTAKTSTNMKPGVRNLLQAACQGIKL